MDPRFQRLSQLFERARQLAPGEELASFLDAECGSDAALRSELEALLASHHESRDPAAAPDLLGEAVAEAWERTTTPAQPPELVEGYRVLDRIGSGGMGTVYLAEQVQPRRRVAIKILRPEAASREGRLRFDREAQALAKLQHPGIAQILATGNCATPAGESPYIVMELVDGPPLHRYAERQGLDVSGRLELLAEVCDAVAHAHQRGIIHRDLKPSNILVDQHGQPKILDFGLARPIDEDSEELRRQTRTGHLLGTLSYMSPEQALGHPDEIDTRSDVYSLGVISYQLLADRLPLEVDDQPLGKAIEAIVDRVPPTLVGVDRDVAIIVGKALAKEKEQRYGGASALSADLRRYLRHEPIYARPPSATYQLRRFVQRHRAPVAGVVATVLALVVGLVLAVQSARSESRERERASYSAARAYLQAAGTALRLSDVQSLRRNLESVPPEHRGWEWRYLHARLDQSIEYEPLPEGFVPHAAGLADHPVWGPRLAAAYGHRLRIDRVAGEPDRVVDPKGALSIPDLSGIGRPFHEAHIDAAGRRLAVVAVGGPTISSWVHLFDLETGAKGPVVTLGTGETECAALSPDGRLVAGGNASVYGFVYDARTGERLSKLLSHTEEVTCVAFDPGSRIVATGSRDRSVVLSDPATGRMIRRLEGLQSTVFAVAFSRDGSRIAASGADGMILLWEVETGRRITALLGHSDTVHHLHFEEGDGAIQSFGDDGWRRWLPLGEESVALLRHHRSRADGNPHPYVYTVAFTPGGNRVVSGGWDNSLQIAEITTGASVASLTTGRVYRLVVRSDGKVITAGHTLALWDLQTYEPLIRSSPVGARFGADLALSADQGRLFLCHDSSSEVQVFDARTLESIETWPGMSGAVRGLDCSRLGLLAAVSEGGTVLVRPSDGSRESRIFRVPGSSGFYAVAFSPDGGTLALGADDGAIRLLDVETLTPTAMLSGHTDIVYALRFHPDGSRLASGANDATVRIWDVAAGKEMLQLRGHRSYIYDLNFSPDGETLASASGDNSVRLWSCRTTRERWQQK